MTRQTRYRPHFRYQNASALYYSVLFFIIIIKVRDCISDWNLDKCWSCNLLGNNGYFDFLIKSLKKPILEFHWLRMGSSLSATISHFPPKTLDVAWRFLPDENNRFEYVFTFFYFYINWFTNMFVMLLVCCPFFVCPCQACFEMLKLIYHLRIFHFFLITLFCSFSLLICFIFFLCESFCFVFVYFF